MQTDTEYPLNEDEVARRAHRVIITMSLLASRLEPSAAKIARKALPLLQPYDRACVLLSTAILEDSGLANCKREKPFQSCLVTIPNPATFHDHTRLEALIRACDPTSAVFGYGTSDTKEVKLEGQAETIAQMVLASIGICYTLHGQRDIKVEREPFLRACADAWAILPNRKLFDSTLGTQFSKDVRKDAYVRLGVQSTRDIRQCGALLLLFLTLFMLTGLILGQTLTSMNVQT